MLTCPKCGVNIRGNKTCCPLCGGRVAGDPVPSPFPYIAPKKVSPFSILRLATFLCLDVEIVLFAVHYLTDFDYPWLTFTMICVLVVWIDLSMTVRYRRNPITLLSWQVYIVCAATVWIDIYSGYRGWSVAWVIPCSLAALSIVTVIIGKGMRLLLEEYIIFLAADMLLSFLQAIPILLHLNPFRWPAVFCIAFLLICGLAAVFFFRKDLKSASSKLFHL